MKKILLMILLIIICAASVYAQDVIIDKTTIENTKKDFETGLRMLTDAEVAKATKEDLIKDFSDSLVKLWILENSTVKNGMFVLYINYSDLFIDKEGNVYVKPNSKAYIKIGNDNYNLEADIKIVTTYKAHVPEPKNKSIFQIEPKLGAVIFTDLKNIDFDVVFLIQVLKIKKINVDLGFGFRSSGIRLAHGVTDNFDIGLYGGIGYPRGTLEWRPVFGVIAAFKF